MKANAPEKMYLEREKETNRIHHLWGRTPVISSLYEHIEYTRTDVFIEKAVQYLKDHKDEVETEDNGIAGWISDKFIEEFVNYMKGE